MSFDANMRALPNGSVFEAKVLTMSEYSSLHLNGTRKGDVVLCEKSMAGNGAVYVYTPNDPTGSIAIVRDETPVEFEWLVYESESDKSALKLAQQYTNKRTQGNRIMNVEIPEFIKQLSEQLNEQSNRMTADPIFCVYYDKKLPTSEDHADGHEYFDKDNCCVIGNFEDLKEHLRNGDYKEFIQDVMADRPNYEAFEDVEESDIDEDDLPEDISKSYYLKDKCFVKASLTESGAQQFIDRKQHDYPKLYIYAESMCYQWQMIELRKWLMSLTADSNKWT